MSCTCQSCNKQYTVDLMVPDEIWQQIKPPVYGRDGLMCPTCIIEAVEKLHENEYQSFTLIETP